MTQLKSYETAKLRLFKQKKQPVSVKKPEVKASTKPQQQPANPTLRPSLTAELPCQQFYPQFPMMTQQDMMNAYMMFCYANPWCFFPPYQ